MYRSKNHLLGWWTDRWVTWCGGTTLSGGGTFYSAADSCNQLNGGLDDVRWRKNGNPKKFSFIYVGLQYNGKFYDFISCKKFSATNVFFSVWLKHWIIFSRVGKIAKTEYYKLRHFCRSVRLPFRMEQLG